MGRSLEGRSLEGKVALVTGASAGGTGRAVAVRSAAEGARVAITARLAQRPGRDARPDSRRRRNWSRVGRLISVTRPAAATPWLRARKTLSGRSTCS